MGAECPCGRVNRDRSAKWMFSHKRRLSLESANVLRAILGKDIMRSRTIDFA